MEKRSRLCLTLRFLCFFPYIRYRGKRGQSFDTRSAFDESIRLDRLAAASYGVERVPGGALEVPFRIIGKAPASCRLGCSPVAFRSLIYRSHPCFRQGYSFQFAIAIQPSACEERRDWRRERPKEAWGLQRPASSRSTNRMASSTTSSRPSNNGDGDSPMSKTAATKLKEARHK
jgi:hypothetical protein